MLMRLDLIIRNTRHARLAVAAIVALGACASGAARPSLPHVLFTTGKGDIEIEVDTVRAPISGSNFLRYVDQGFYNGGRFHRTVRPDNQPQDSVRIAVIQAGVDPARARSGFPPIPLERTSVTGLKHLDGSVSMARGGPDAATSSFFICIGDQPSLDFGGHRNMDLQGFAAFGRVVRGMDVVRDIQSGPANAQTLIQPVQITSARRIAGLP